MINVTKPYLPNIEDYIKHLKCIWQTSYLTNNGPLHQVLEKKLASFLSLSDLCIVNNCTSGLLMSLNDIETGGEIITTPFSFVATTSSILWSKLKPVFCDIDKDFFFIDTEKIEKLITPKTKAVLATHVFGNTGNIDNLEYICQKHNIKLIFDAAHCFGVDYKNKSILEYGDISILSFHATKLYHTIEGGAIYSKNQNDMQKFKCMRNFGIENYEIIEIGINSKMSEFCCAMGLCNLDNIEKITINIKKIYNLYNDALAKLYSENKLIKFKINPNLKWNYSYYPIIFNEEIDLLKCLDALKKHNIMPKRYFYPSLNILKFIDNNNTMKISEDISRRILCLPFYYGLEENTINLISDKITSIF